MDSRNDRHTLLHWARRLAVFTSVVLLVAIAGAALEIPARATSTSRSADIVAALPAELGGAVPQVTVYDGPEWTARLDPSIPEEAQAIAQIATFVGSLGATVDELTVVSARYDIAPGNIVAITAYRLDDVPASDLAMPVLRAAYGPDAELSTKVSTVAGSEVIKVRDSTMPGVYPRFLRVVDDVIWIIDADKSYREPVLTALPASADGTAPTLLFEPAGESIWRITEPQRQCRSWYRGEAFGGPDGSLWFANDAGVRQLGACEVLGVGGPSMFAARDAAMAPDGTLWLLDGSRLMSWDGDDWNVVREGFNADGGACSEQDCYWQVEVAPDGTVWLGGSTVSSFDGTEWRDHLLGEPASIRTIGLDGSVWLAGFDGARYVIRPSE